MSWLRNLRVDQLAMSALKGFNDWNPVKDQIYAEYDACSASRSHASLEEDLWATKQELAALKAQHEQQARQLRVVLQSEADAGVSRVKMEWRLAAYDHCLQELLVSHNDVHHAVLPSALHQPQPAAAPGIDAAVAVKQQEPFVVPDPNDSGSSLTGNATSTAASPSGFIVAYQSLARGEMSFGSPTSRRTAAVDQPMHQISSGLPPEQADEQTLALLHEVSQPLLPEPLPGSTSTTFCTQPVVKLVSNFIRPVQPESCSTHLSSKKARKPGGYTFCGDVEDTDVFADHLLPQDNSNTTFNEDCRSFIRFSKVSDKFRLVR